jgi:hypothetical protein
MPEISKIKIETAQTQDSYEIKDAEVRAILAALLNQQPKEEESEE